MILPSTLHNICGQGRHSHPSLCQVYLFKVEREINPQNGCLKAVMRLSTQFCLISTWHSLIQSCNPSLIYSSISSFTIVIYQWIQEHEDLFYFLCSVVCLLIYLLIYLFFSLVEMALTVDQVFEKIGSFGRYQKLLLLGCNGLIFFWMGFAVLIMTFIAADPGWKCVANSTQCRFNGSMAASDKRRCDMNRSEWVFNDDLTSVATEVRGI